MKHESLHIEHHGTPGASWRNRLSAHFGRYFASLAEQHRAFDTFLYNDFVFSPRYKVWRHVVYWTFHVLIWATFWWIMKVAPVTFGRNVFNMLLWVPVFILFGYPMTYWAVPKLLLRGKVIQFSLTVLAWAFVGLWINAAYRTYLYVPLNEALDFDFIPAKGQNSNSYLCMTTSAASPMIIQFFKLWTMRQREWITSQQEKIVAELQLLKAQVHPNFLFNALNNIYTFSLQRSPKTPGQILRLSSLLSYMLYDCNAEQVRLEKEIEVMKNYLDLEHERHGDKVEVSWSVEGNTKDRFISPLLILPFMENAYKHCMASDIQRSWISVDLSVRGDVVRCKIANSKRELTQGKKPSGKDIQNVSRRLALAYPQSHQLFTHDEGSFYVVSVLIKLTGFREVAAWQKTHVASQASQMLYV